MANHAGRPIITEDEYAPIRKALFDGPPGQSGAEARRRIAEELDAADLHIGKGPKPTPLEDMGLGPMWRPTRSMWAWAKISTGDGLLHILRVYNAGGVMGFTFGDDEQLSRFAADAKARLEPEEAKVVVPEPPKLIVPGR